MNNRMPGHHTETFKSKFQDEPVLSPNVDRIRVSTYQEYRSTVNVIPKDLQVLESSKIPFVININPEDFTNESVEMSQDPIVRCDKCKTYINPFIEIIPPGTLWKCNMCQSINKLAVPFRQIKPFERSGAFNPIENYDINTSHFLNPELQHSIIDIIAPPNFSIKPTPDPVFFFAIEATRSTLKDGTFKSVLNCIVSNLEFLPNATSRTKIVITFFNSCAFVLRKAENTRFIVVPDFDNLPSFYSEDIFFGKEELRIDVEEIEAYFMDTADARNDFGGELCLIKRILGTSGTVMVFLGSVPNVGFGTIDTAKGDIKCKSTFYKKKAFELAKAAISVNYFLFPHLNIELPTLSILSKYTGGMLNYYPNYDANDPSFSSKLATDLSLFLEQNIGYEAVCKIRVPNDVTVKEYYGNLSVRSSGIVSFCNLYPSHSFTIEIKIDEKIPSTALTVQVALLRNLESGEKVIRILNFAIPIDSTSSTSAFYESIDPNMLAHCYALKAIFNEAKKRGDGNAFLARELKELSNCYKKNMKLGSKELVLPESMSTLPVQILSLMKSIPLRPSAYTPPDYKAYYIYLLYTQYPKLIDTLIYPALYSLHNLDGNVGVVKNNRTVMPKPINLTLDLLETFGFYLLDTGVNLYFFIGRDCKEEIPRLVVDPDVTGRFVLEKLDNELSERVNNILNEMRHGRFITPNYYVLRDNGKSDMLLEIFFSYFVEDTIHNVPSYADFVRGMNR